MLGRQADGAGPGAVLPREFFGRPALSVGARLLGCVLEHETAAGLVAAELTEVEAYEGESDPASHAFRGRTARNAVMFGPPGHAYVYFTYGMHFCVNLVCGPEGMASAVLLRAGRVIEGTALALERRPAAGPGGRDLARGPARLCQALGIGRELNGADVCDPGSPLRVRAGRLPGGGVPGSGVPGGGMAGGGMAGGGMAGLPVSSGPRVGVNGAAERPWRFWVTGDPTVSVYRPHVRRSRRAPGTQAAGRDAAGK